MLHHHRNSRLLRRVLAQIYCCNNYSTTSFAAFSLGNAKDQRKSSKISLPKKGFFRHIFTASVKCSDKQPPVENSAELPKVLQEQCKKWEKAIKAEQQAREGKHPWMDYSLKCTNVLPGFNTSQLIMSLEKLSKESKQVFKRYYKIGTPVRLRPSNADPWKGELTGTIRNYYDDQQDGYKNPGTRVKIKLKGNFNKDEEKQIKNSLFDIKIEADDKFTAQLEFLERSNEWIGMAGYNAMLCAFKCKPMPQIGQDPVDWIDVEKEKNSFDQSQWKAILAALNPKRPIVAIHGPPGTGKTLSIVYILEELIKQVFCGMRKFCTSQGKRPIVLSPSLAALYNLIGNYQHNFDYLILKNFDEVLANKIIQDPKKRLIIKERSMNMLSTDVQGQKTRKYYKMTNYLQREMKKAMEGGKNAELLDEILEVRQMGIEESRQLNDLDTKKHIEENGRIIFTTVSRASINLLTRNGISFDALIVEEAAAMNELKTWWMGLPLAPNIILFGNRDNPAMPLSSPEARELCYNKSLLERLDEQFGPDEVNFHLQRQYRSAPAIQEWPNSVFYGKRAAEADKSVKDIKLDDLLVPDAKMPQQGGPSWYNWGEALLVAQHMRLLFKHFKHSQIPQIAYFTQCQAQCLRVQRIFECFLPSQLENLQMVRFDKTHEFQGQSVDVVLKSFVKKPETHALKEQYNLKHLAFEMTRAKRQFMLLAKREWLEEGSDESRQLLDTFRNHGRIIGPNDLLQMDPDKFYHMQREHVKWHNERRRLEQTTRN